MLTHNMMALPQSGAYRGHSQHLKEPCSSGLTPHVVCKGNKQLFKKICFADFENYSLS